MIRSLSPFKTISRAVRRALHNRVAKQRREYMAIPASPLPCTLERKLRATSIDGPEAERYPKRVPHQDGQAAVVLSPPPHSLLLKGQPQAHKRTNVRVRGRNGDFFTISMEPKEWREPIPASPKKKCSTANNSTATTTTMRESSQEDRVGYTAAEAAGHYRNGACLAAWPVGEDGGEWRSVRPKTSAW